MIFNIGGAAFKPPVLNPNYPADVSVVQSSSASATFQVVIQEAGEPAEYAYQWYVNNSPVSGATSTSYTKTNLSSVGTYVIYCTVTHPAGVVTSRSATLAVQSSQPSYTYSGAHTLVKEGTYDWKLTLKTSGTLRFSTTGTGGGAVQVFLVGGGGGGFTGGGGGGYTTTADASFQTGKDYSIVVGAGGGTRTSGGQSSALGKTANGGVGATDDGGGNGGSGGGSYGGSQRGGTGGSDGGNGLRGYDNNPLWAPGGTGQGTTTREFGSSSGTLYSGGGGGAGDPNGTGGSGGGGNGGQAGGINTGGGGGGQNSGGSGIVIIRNKR